MSRSLIKQKVRKNDDYAVVTGILEDLRARGVDIAWSVEMPTGKGAHPKIMVSYEGQKKGFTIAHTPGKVNRRAVKRSFMTFLKEEFTEHERKRHAS